MAYTPLPLPSLRQWDHKFHNLGRGLNEHHNYACGLPQIYMRVKKNIYKDLSLYDL